MVNQKFSRSQLLRERHKEAKLQRQFYVEKFGKENTPSYFEFLKRETPLEREVISYDVSFQVSYRGVSNAFESTPKTFRVYGFAGEESEIQKRTMNMILDSKGAITGSNFVGGTLDMIEQNTSVKITRDIYPRGMEESNKKVSRNQTQKIVESGFYVEDLDSKFKFENKNKREGEMRLDISHFM